MLIFELLFNAADIFLPLLLLFLLPSSPSETAHGNAAASQKTD